MFFSRVKISFRAKAHLVFHWCLYYIFTNLFAVKICAFHNTGDNNKLLSNTLTFFVDIN